MYKRQAHTLGCVRQLNPSAHATTPRTTNNRCCARASDPPWCAQLGRERARRARRHVPRRCLWTRVIAAARKLHLRALVGALPAIAHFGIRTRWRPFRRNGTQKTRPHAWRDHGPTCVVGIAAPCARVATLTVSGRACTQQPARAVQARPYAADERRSGVLAQRRTPCMRARSRAPSAKIFFWSSACAAIVRRAPITNALRRSSCLMSRADSARPL